MLCSQAFASGCIRSPARLRSDLSLTASRAQVDDLLENMGKEIMTRVQELAAAKTMAMDVANFGVEDWERIAEPPQPAAF